MTLSHPQFDWSVLPVPIEMLVIARTYSNAEYITPLLQFLGSGNTGENSVFYHAIVPLAIAIGDTGIYSGQEI